MSGPNLSLLSSQAEAAGFNYLESLFSTSATRSISWIAEDSDGNPTQGTDPLSGLPLATTLYPQIVAQEHSIDELELTRHPVERGAAVTDHAYRRPAQVQIRGGWSFSQPSSFLTLLPKPTDPDYLSNLYDILRSIQKQRAFVTLVTGKRTYTYMLLQSLSVTTDEGTENVLEFIANFQELLLAQTKVVTVPDPSVMKSPAITAATTNQGNTSLLPGDNANLPALRGALPLDLQDVHQ